jgi:hypothetical protein
MKQLLVLWMVLGGLATDLLGQGVDSTGKKTIQAIYVEKAPKIDGVLDDAVWANAPIATDFTEYTPNPGRKASQRTEVKVLYTTEGIYIGAKMYDTAADSILKQLSVRDALGNVNADNFSVYIDGMYTQQTDFAFQVTAAGVQIDQNAGDEIWDAVWKSSVKIEEYGWVAELEIPYSQLRFPKSDIQTWGINFGRSIRRSRQEFYWSPIDPTQENIVQQQGLMTGIERVKPPVRLSFTPYVSGYLNHSFDGATGKHTLTPNFSAGADMKYGINESFTLDVALVPDFGDVQSDNLVFNLSPFEIYYAERRPFFTEGVELFSRADLFYSRRIGSRPARYGLASGRLDSTEFITKNPEKPYLINALKVSGRTKKGLGLGLFNAVTAPAFAQIQNDSGDTRRYETESFTNYNVVVVDQQFWKHSYVSLINASVVRFGGYTDALATGTEFKIADKKNLYGVSGSAAMSHRFLDTMKHAKNYENGYRYDLSFQKFSGNFRFRIRQQTMSKYYNINDIGFVGRANYINTTASVMYNIYKPFGRILRMWSSFDASYEMLYNPAVFTRIQFGGEWGGTLTNFLSLGADFRVEPIGYNDYFESRTEEQVWTKPTWTRINFWFSSDYRKVFALDGGINYRRFWGQGAWAASDVIGGRLKPLIRFSDNFNMILSANLTVRRNSLGYVTKTIDNNTGEDQIVFGSRFRQDLETWIAANYLFTNKISLTLRVRHYWAVVDYNEFYSLTSNGGMEPIAYSGNHDTNFNAFNIDLIFRWRFAPGSELNVVWKNAVLSSGTDPNYDYFNNFGGMFETGQNNQFSIKALYYLDFFTLFKKKNRGKRLD